MKKLFDVTVQYTGYRTVQVAAESEEDIELDKVVADLNKDDLVQGEWDIIEVTPGELEPIIGED